MYGLTECSGARVLAERPSPCGQWPLYTSQPSCHLALNSILWSLREKPFPTAVNCTHKVTLVVT